MSDASTRSAWTRMFYPRHGDGVAFDRVVFFSDAVFAIALTLAAVEIGIPEPEADTAEALQSAIVAKGPIVGAYLVAFIWVAIYWRANHRFVMTLRGMNGPYVAATLVYLALVALLPIPAAVLGEFWDFPLAVTIFALYASAVSLMEVVLFVVADRGALFRAPLSPQFRRQQILGSLSPLVAFLGSIPIAYALGTGWAIAWWVVASMGAGFLLSRFAHAQPPDDPPGDD